MSCAHSHSHGHHHHAPAFEPALHRAFLYGIILNMGFVAVEVFYGYAAHSLSLVADALHNFGDALGLVMAWLGYAMGFRKPTHRFTYGFGRVSIYATVANGALLIGSTLWIVWEAWLRLHHPQMPQARTVGIVAAIGIAINGLTAFLLMRKQHDVNVRGAMLHMAADASVSLGVVVTAAAIAWTGALWLDPLVSFAIAIVILVGGWPVLYEGIRLSLDAVPGHVDRDAIRAFLEQNPDVAGVFDLHVWGLSTTKTAVSAHVTVKSPARADDIVQDLHRDLKKQFGIAHATLQVEKDHQLCANAHETVEG